MQTNFVSLRPILVVKKIYILSENRHLRFWHASCNSLLATPVSVERKEEGRKKRSMNCKLTEDWENEDDRVYIYNRKEGMKMEKILMHPIISRAMANMTRTPKEEKERRAMEAMTRTPNLVNTRRHIS